MSDEQRTHAQANAMAPADKYDRLMSLADLFEASGEEMRSRSQLGETVLRDDEVAASTELAPKTFAQLEEDVRHATSGKRGLLARSIELDADALMVRATVLTYRWIDDLQEAAYKTLGSIAGRAIGYLAPEVALGGAIVSAGLIETDVLDRDGVADYINELAEKNPELLDHVSSGGGGLLDSLQMRSILTAGALAGAGGPSASRGGLTAAGIAPMAADMGDALRDVAGGLTIAPEAASAALDAAAGIQAAPRSVEELMTLLSSAEAAITVNKVAADRFIAYLPGPSGARTGRVRLVGGDHSAYTRQVVAALEEAVASTSSGGEASGQNGTAAAKVMLVGSAQGGLAAAEVAAHGHSESFVVDQLITAGAPGSQVQRIPKETRVLSLEDRADPVALLGSLINAEVTNRLTVVFDAHHDAGAGSATGEVEHPYVTGGRAADHATHPDLRAEILRLHELGYLSA